ncbi:MAG: DUF5711 family protein [Oscillospiraceae bacterium]
MAEGKNKTTKKKKTTKNQEPLIKIIKAVSVILVMLVLLFIAADTFGNITFSSVGDYVNSVISGTKRGNGYPYYFENLSANDIKPIGSDFLILANDSTIVLDSTARRVSTLQHTYSNPIVDSVGSRALMIDVGETSYRVQSKTKVLYEGKTKQKILTGAIGRNGTIGLAVRGEASVSELIVLDKNQKEVFRWACAKENIIGIDISDNGKKAAVILVGAENGELYTKVVVFDFAYAEPINQLDFAGKIISKVEFLYGNNLLITGEKTFCLLNNLKDKKEEDLSLNTLSRICTSDSNISVCVLSKYGSATSKIVKVYNKKGDLLFETEINKGIRSVSTDGSNISILTDNEIINYNRKGKEIGRMEVESDGIKVFTLGTYTYEWTTSKIDCYRTIGEKEKHTEKNVLNETTSSQSTEKAIA